MTLLAPPPLAYSSLAAARVLTLPLSPLSPPCAAAFVKNCQHRKPNFVLQQQGAPGYAPQQAMYAQPMPPMPMQPQMQMQPQPQYYPQQAPMQPPYGGQPMYAQQPPPMYGGVPQGYAQQPQYQPVQQQQQYPQAFRNSV